MNPFLDNSMNGEGGEDAELKALVERYERMANGGRQSYLEEDDFMEIIYHYLGNREMDKALQAIAAARERYPDRTEIIMLNTIVLLEDGQFNRAMKCVRLLETLDCNDLEVLHAKAMVLIAAGKTDRGVAILNGLLKQTDSNEDILHLLLPAIDYLNRTQAHAPALQYAKRLHSAYPQDAHAIYLLARCHKNCGNLKASITNYNAYLKINNEEDIWLELGALYEQNNQPRKALQIYDKVIKANPDNVKGYWHKASFFSASKQYNEVEKVHDDLLKQKPDFVPAWYTKGRCYAEMGRRDAAMECYCKAAALDPCYSDAYYAMAMTMMSAGRVKLQMEFIQRALALDPFNQGYYLCLVNGLAAQEQWQQVERSLRHCLQIEDDFAPAWLLLADLQAREDCHQAAATLERAKDRLPNDERIAVHLAVMYFKSGNAAKCWQQLKLAMRDHPICVIEFVQNCPEALNNPALLKVIRSVGLQG